MKNYPTQEYHGTHERNGNNVHNRQVRDKNPKRLAFAYDHECLMQSLAFIIASSDTAIRALATLGLNQSEIGRAVNPQNKNQ